MKHLLIVTVGLFFYTLAAKAQLAPKSKFYVLDRSHSEMTFAIKWMAKGKVLGTFDNVSGMIFYDPQKPRELSASLLIDIKSLNTGNPARNSTLMKDWFDTAAHPTAYFESLPIGQQDKPGKIKGRFTLKGITKIISLDVAKIDPPAPDYETNPFIIVAGKTTISRSEFNVRMATSRYETSQSNAVAIADSVLIEFNLYGRQTSLNNALLRMGPADGRTATLLNQAKNATAAQTQQLLDSFYKAPNSARDISAWTIGNYFLTASEADKALIFFNKADAVFPENMNVFDSMMQYYYHLGNKEEARKWMDKILRKNPRSPAALEYQKRLNKI